MTRKPLAPWIVRDSRSVMKDRWIDLRAYRFETGAGAIVDPYYIVHRHDWACVLALDDADRAVMVRIWRQAIGTESIELPSGAIDATDADPAAGVRRELLEETGYTCGDLLPVARLATNAANHTNFMHVFAARGARFMQDPQLEPGETLVTELLPVADLKAMTLSGQIVHGLQVAAILLALETLAIR